MGSPRVLIFFVVILLGWSSISRADLMLSISSPDDLSDLTVGQEFLIQVSLSGLTTEELDSLAVDVVVDEAGFSNPSTPLAGAIVPSPADNFDPFSFADPDLVTGAFLLESGVTGIDTNGVFFVFTMAVAEVGSGTIGFDPGSALAITTSDEFLEIIEGAAVPYTAIPEPMTISILGFAMIGWLRRRRRE